MTAKELKQFQTDKAFLEFEQQMGKKIYRTKKGKPDLRSVKVRTPAQIAATERMLAANKAKREAKQKGDESAQKSSQKQAVKEVVSELARMPMARTPTMTRDQYASYLLNS